MTKPLSTDEKARRASARKQPVRALRADPVFDKVKPTSKADKVRAAFLQNPAERPSVVAKATGVDPAYVWDIREAMRRKNLIPRVQPEAAAKPVRKSSYAKRVRALEAEGMTTSDAQAAVDAEDLGRYDSIEGVRPPRKRRQR